MIASMLRKNLWLAGLFLLALPVFCWLQWQPGPWLEGQLQSRGLGTLVHFAAVHKSIRGLLLDKPEIRAPNLPPLEFDSLLLRPALGAILKGSPGLYAHASGQGMQAEVDLSMRAAQLDLDKLDIRLDAGKLAHFDSRLLLLALKGELGVRGHVRLQADTGLPLAGSLQASWKAPTSTLLPAELKDIRLSLNSDNAKGEKLWNWKLDSQPGQLAGHGKIVANGPDVRRWLLSGSLQLAEGKPAMALSGTVGAPHLQ